MKAMEAVLDLRWEAPSGAEQATVLITRQRFLELSDAGDHVGAAAALDGIDRALVADLPRLFMCKDSAELRAVAGWASEGLDRARMDVWEAMEVLIDPSQWVRPSRLLASLDDALRYQITRCEYHIAGSNRLSLYRPHACERASARRRCEKVSCRTRWGRGIACLILN